LAIPVANQTRALVAQKGEVKMFGTYQRLNVHVLSSDREVIRAARKKLSKAGRAPSAKAFRRQFYREMLRYHHDAAKLFLHYRF
jgi:hypothetical protein